MSLKGVLPERASIWLDRHRREAIDLVALIAAILVADLLIAPLPAFGAAAAVIAAMLVPLRPLSGKATPWREFTASVPRLISSVAVSAAVVRYLLGAPLTGLSYSILWPVFAVGIRLDHPRIAAWIQRQRWLLVPFQAEVTKIVLLAFSALWLMHGFERATLHGGADAQWYGMNLADAVAQFRKGVFPLYVGQSVYQFNGAICPIRVAPAFHYLGGLLDLFTFHKLGTFALQNTLLTLIAVAAIFTTYAGLRSLMPQRAWLAAGLAALFMSCPGVLGISYNTDLYMTWTTLPLVPVIWYASVRSFLDKGSLRTMGLLGCALGLSWWGHSPIALWSTFFAGACQAVRLASEWRSGVDWKSSLAGALVFLAVAGYPIGSVILFPPEPLDHLKLYQHATAAVLSSFLREVTPDAYLPLSATGRELSDFQLGYALWIIFMIVVWVQCRSKRPVSIATAGSALLLALLLIPIPFLNIALWTLVPGFVRDVTGNWAMDRLYLLLSASTVFAVAACNASGLLESKATRHAISLAVGLGCIWSFAEANKFSVGSKILSASADTAQNLTLTENVQITRYSYSLLPGFPAYPSNFTHGVTDPELENHLLDDGMASSVQTNLSVARASAQQIGKGNFNWGREGNDDHATLDLGIHLSPGKSYLLEINFADPDEIHGVLQIKGHRLFREYGLPEYGNKTSFGAGGMHSHLIPLWTTSGEQDVQVYFYPTTPPAARGKPVGSVSFLTYEKTSLPVRVTSWIPFEASVRSPKQAWLETPRVFQTAYSATVDGRPVEVRKSPDSLVVVQVPEGLSRVILTYKAPLGLQALFWLACGTTLFVVGSLGSLGILNLLRSPSPANTSESRFAR